MTNGLNPHLNFSYGAVTTGEDWRFGVYHRANRQVIQDQKRYQVPEDLSVLVKIIVGIISGS